MVGCTWAVSSQVWRGVANLAATAVLHQCCALLASEDLLAVSYGTLEAGVGHHDCAVRVHSALELGQTWGLLIDHTLTCTASTAATCCSMTLLAAHRDISYR